MNTTLHTNLPTLSEYYDQLARHDWTYEYSDDGAAWRKGYANDERLQRIAAAGGSAYQQLFIAWAKYSDHKRDKPERPQEENHVANS